LSNQTRNRAVKAHSTLSLLGAPSWDFVSQWIEFTHTTEEGDTTSVKHIDHFISCARFDLSDPEQQRECFNRANLRIMSASENISKNAKLHYCYHITSHRISIEISVKLVSYHLYFTGV